MKKRVLLVGAAGEIGMTLFTRLGETYHFVLCDIGENSAGLPNYYRVDATDLPAIRQIIKKESIDVVINLAGLPEAALIPEKEVFLRMLDVYVNTTYTLLKAMAELGVKKFILASSNHVTDCYEENGYSTLGREITADDFPLSKGIYGSLKYASESICRNFHLNCGIQCLCLRIGTYRRQVSGEELSSPHERWQKTILSPEDLVAFFTGAIENEVPFGTFYLVSDHRDKPWNNSDTKIYLGDKGV